MNEAGHKTLASQKIMKKKYDRIYLPMTGDLFHMGHLNAINYCYSKLEPDFLYIGLLTDRVIEKYKGEKPIIPFEERMSILLHLMHSYGDLLVEKQNDINPYKNLVKFNIDTLASGDGFEPIEKEAAKKAGCKLLHFQYYKKQSTTKIKEKIIKQYEDLKN